MRYLGAIVLIMAISCEGCSEPGTPSPAPFLDVHFSPNGKWLACGGGDSAANASNGIVKVWQTDGWKLYSSWKDSYTSPVERINFDGPEVIVTTSVKIIKDARGNPCDGTLIRRWNLKTKLELMPIELKDYFGGKALAYDGKGKSVAFNHFTPPVSGIYTLPDLKEKVLLKGCPPATLRFSPDRTQLLAAISAIDSPQVRIYDATDGKLLHTRNLEASRKKSDPTSVQAAEFSPNGKMIAVGTIYPMRVYVFKADLSALQLSLDTKSNRPPCVRFASVSSMIAVKQDRNDVHLLDIATKKTVRVFGGNVEGVNAWCFSPDGTWIAIASGGHLNKNGAPSPGRVRVFEVKTGKLVAELK